MNTKQSILSTLSCLLFFCLVTNASAGAPLKCEKRTSPPRSKISVEAEGLVPNTIYTVNVTSNSGLNTASVSGAADLFGDVEVDFDSNLKDILGGATPLVPTFIVGDVTATVTKQIGGDVVANLTAICKIK